MLLVLISLCASVSLTLAQGQEDRCGVPNVVPGARIVGGIDSERGKWPWQVLLREDGDHICGGTLINHEWVITAAHCIDTGIGSYSVVLGAHHRNGLDDSAQEFRLSSIICHDDYDDDTFANDICLLRLSVLVVYNDHIRPACLPAADTHLQDNQLCSVTGWGKTLEVPEPLNPVLREAQVRVINRNQCVEWYQEEEESEDIDGDLRQLVEEDEGEDEEENRESIPENHFCAGYAAGGIDACQGDSGGPLVCQEYTSAGQAYVLRGVTSYGVGCAQRERPGVYTTVESYLNWINERINQGSTVRLVGGSGSHEGRVEVYHNGEWGTICDDSWDLSDATVVCRMLGYSGAISAPSYARFGRGDGQIWLDDVDCTGNEINIDACPHGGWASHNCGHHEDASAVCYRGSGQPSNIVRLRDGTRSTEGRVEVFYNGEWGTICDDHWSISDAEVVCRMLGYQSAIAAPPSAFYGPGTGPIWLDDVSCFGSEASITDCGHAGWGNDNCAHNEDASVQCSDTSVRLVNGDSLSQGRVEIRYNGEWGTICDDLWDLNDARVICRMLGYPDAASAPTQARFGQGIGRIWLDDVQCIGSEMSINDCVHRTWGSHNCVHQEDASAICTTSISSTTTVRLVGGSGSHEGRVEVNHDGQWGTICDDSWELSEATVVCHMLGYSAALSAPTNAQFGQGVGQIWLDDVGCTGSETNIDACPHGGWGSHNCGHHEDASVVCFPLISSITTVRLVGGSGSHEGRVEVNHYGEWGTICDDSWGLSEATVVCRMLGYSAALSAPSNARFGQGVGQIWLDDVGCTGIESNIGSCQHRGWGDHNCAHREDASVVCSIIGQPLLRTAVQRMGRDDLVRLVNGGRNHQGRVEILYNGEWGTICDDSWDMNSGHVVCRMLGFENATAIHRGAYFGEGDGKIWIERVNCTGSETNIEDCQLGNRGTESCTHSKDASVECTPVTEVSGEEELCGGRVCSEPTPLCCEYSGSGNSFCCAESPKILEYTGQPNDDGKAVIQPETFVLIVAVCLSVVFVVCIAMLLMYKSWKIRNARLQEKSSLGFVNCNRMKELPYISHIPMDEKADEDGQNVTRNEFPL